MHRYMMCGVRL